MVSRNYDVSSYGGTPPDPDDDLDIKEGGPIYPVEDIKALAEQGRVTLWSRGAQEDAQKWELDSDELAFLARLALDQNGYLHSRWCLQGRDGPWAACDAYQVTRKEWVPTARREMTIKYYLKFGISKAGTVLLMVSNHPEDT